MDKIKVTRHASGSGKTGDDAVLVIYISFYEVQQNLRDVPYLYITASPSYIRNNTDTEYSRSGRSWTSLIVVLEEAFSPIFRNLQREMILIGWIFTRVLIVTRLRLCV